MLGGSSSGSPYRHRRGRPGTRTRYNRGVLKTRFNRSQLRQPITPPPPHPPWSGRYQQPVLSLRAVPAGQPGTECGAGGGRGRVCVCVSVLLSVLRAVVCVCACLFKQ